MSKLDNIKIALEEYDAAMGVYSDTMEDVEAGRLGLDSIADADDVNTTASIDFSGEARDFIGEILPHIEKLRVAWHSGRTARIDSAVGSLIDAIESKPDPSQGGTDKE